MSARAEAFAAAAESLLGTPFRLHGRDPRFGVDCLGLVVTALAAAGTTVTESSSYGLRNSCVKRFHPLAETAGFKRICGTPLRGDLLLVRPGPAQHHLLVALDGERFVHAHAGLRRVASHSGPLPWPLAAHWQLTAIEEQ